MPGRLFRNNKAKCGPAGETAEGRIPHAARFVHTFRMGATAPRQWTIRCQKLFSSGCLKTLDYGKRYFTSSDIALLDKYKYDIDNQILESDMAFFATLQATSVFKRKTPHRYPLHWIPFWRNRWISTPRKPLTQTNRTMPRT